MNYISDSDILKWLNQQKKLEVLGEPTSIAIALGGNLDDLSGPGHFFEGFSLRGIQFLDSDGNGSVISSNPDAEKKGCRFTVATVTFVWVREGEEQILDLIEHDYRLATLQC